MAFTRSRTASSSLGKYSSKFGNTRGASLSGGITVIGVPQAIAKIQAVQQIVFRDAGLIPYRAAQAVQQQARAIVPVKEGWLRNGIVIEKQGPYTYAISASSVAGGADKEYAAHVEFGTYKMSAQPYMQPAIDAARGPARAALAALAAKVQAL
jgi:HK97 gp10 family phage protein